MSQDYKNTMNLPKTGFPMRAGLVQSEPKRLEKWEAMGLYQRMLERNAGNEPYILHDGPPYANGPLHIGTAFNKILKDIIVKYRSMRGCFAPYVPGWDCHGQPIEHMVEKTIGPERMAAISKAELRSLCRDWATRHVDLQREGFKRLGVLGDWADPYLTYVPAYEAGNVEVFKRMYATGAIYRGRKPIHWCCHDHTALAEAELEYADVESPSIYVAFAVTNAGETPLAEAAALLPEGEAAWLLIWTTTPWTLPANVAVALASDASYRLVRMQGDNPALAGKWLLVAEELAERVAEELGASGMELAQGAGSSPWTAKGSELEGVAYAHPIHAEMAGVVITGAHVTLDTGTGAVHTAPGHGQEDYLAGVEHSLPLLMPVDADGVFDAGGGPFEGLQVEAANPVITDWLKDRGTLMAARKFTHSYPHCWRCKKPVIFRATDQWFVSMEATGLRDKALTEINALRWYPEWSANRMRAMVEGRPDWCISRQRSWGVPIPVFKCAKCGSTVATDATFDAVIELFGREGADAWFIRDPAEYLPAGVACEVCGCTELQPERDILDVWWESGVSHTSVLRAREQLSCPADLYLEGSDQHRGWFQSSLLTSVGAYGAAPYKAIMSCGFIVDGSGRKMSKSLGNVVDPADVIASFGADVLRLWVGSIDSSQDVGIDDEILKRTSEAYRRFRNTFRFLLSNLYDYSLGEACDWDGLLELDRWALVRLERVAEAATAAYEANRFHLAYHAIYDYVVSDLSAVYMDALKDRLYSDAPASSERKSAQTALANILEVLVRLLAPLITFTCDEVLENYPEGMSEGKPEAITLADWPSSASLVPQIPAGEAERLNGVFEHVLAARDVVTKALEDARGAKSIGKSQEAAVTLTLPEDALGALAGLPKGTLEELFIVSEVELMPAGGTGQAAGAPAPAPAPAMSAQIAQAAGEKCPRCWNVREPAGDAAHPGLCQRCLSVLAQMGELDGAQGQKDAACARGGEGLAG